MTPQEYFQPSRLIYMSNLPVKTSVAPLTFVAMEFVYPIVTAFLSVLINVVINKEEYEKNDERRSTSKNRGT